MKDVLSIEKVKDEIRRAKDLSEEVGERLEKNLELFKFERNLPSSLEERFRHEIRVFTFLSEEYEKFLQMDLMTQILLEQLAEVTENVQGFYEGLKSVSGMARNVLDKDAPDHCEKMLKAIGLLKSQLAALRDPGRGYEEKVANFILDVERAYGCNFSQMASMQETEKPGRRAGRDEQLSKRVCRLLHLSDLHFSGENEQVDRWHEQLAADLREQGCDKLDGIIISGDIVYGSAEASIEDRFLAATRFLKRVMDEFSVPANRIVIVPGNHDLDWGRSREAYKFKYLKDAGELDEGEYLPAGNQGVLVRDDEKYPERFQAFSAFYREICGEDYPRMLDDQRTLNHFQEQGLLFLGLNSAWETDHGFTSRASINDAALSRALTAIRGRHEWADCLKIAVWHHPVTSGDDDRIRDDAFLQRLAKAGFRLALHGHIHKADTGLYRYDHSPAGRRIEFVGAGTFGAPSREWVPGYPAQYNLLGLSGNRLTVNTRRREEKNGVWKPDARWERGSGQDPLPRYTVPLA